jgi:glutamine synthetase
MRRHADPVPGSPGGLIQKFEASNVFIETVGPHPFKQHVQAKTHVWGKYRHVVAQWELDRYQAL